jgi:hypothetical protein
MEKNVGGEGKNYSMIKPQSNLLKISFHSHNRTVDESTDNFIQFFYINSIAVMFNNEHHHSKNGAPREGNERSNE